MRRIKHFCGEAPHCSSLGHHRGIVSLANCGNAHLLASDFAVHRIKINGNEIINFIRQQNWVTTFEHRYVSICSAVASISICRLDKMDKFDENSLNLRELFKFVNYLLTSLFKILFFRIFIGLLLWSLRSGSSPCRSHRRPWDVKFFRKSVKACFRPRFGW